MLDYLNYSLYDMENIMKYDKGELNMNKRLFLPVCMMCLWGVGGCVHNNSAYTAQCNGQNCPVQEVVVEEVALPADDYICQTTDDPALCPTDPFVNYTSTAADFREYGERNPRDRMISQAAAGNNLSAAIPPSIEDEVIEYEEQINPGSDLASVTEEVVEEEIAETDDETSGDIEDEEGMEDVEDPVQDWLAEEGQNLKALLTDWSEKSGWRLVWNTNRNYVLSAGAMFRGRFADVSSALIRAFARARPAPIATFYKGNRVLVVETMEDENAYE